MTRALSVLQISQWGIFGGGPHVVYLLATQLKSLGVDSAALCLSDGVLREMLTRQGVPCTLVPVHSKLDLTAIAALRRYLQAHRPDIVHSHGPRAMFWGNIAARLASVPAVVTTFHTLSSVALLQNPRYWLYHWMEGLLSRTCTDGCIGFSESVCADSIRARHVPTAKLCCIYNGVDLERFQRCIERTTIDAEKKRWGIGPQDVIIGAVGSLISAKGHRYLIQALPYIRSVIPNARILIAGDGALRDELSALAQQCGVAQDVIFTGETFDVATLYHCFDVFVYPSIRGAFGIVLLEAMASGVPVVTSRLNGTAELISDGQTGLLTAAGDSHAIANAVIGLISDRERATRTACRAYEHVVANFSAGAMARRHLAYYQALYDRRRPAPL